MSQLARTTQGAAPMTPRTPRSASATPSIQREEESTPGRWKHPQFDEIARRQYVTTFDERNVKMIVTNGSLLVGTFAAPAVISQITLLRTLSKPVLGLLHQLPYNGDEWTLFLFRLIFLVNLVRAFMPLARRYFPDDIADIPLTPSQRLAMGLRPGVAIPQSPGSGYASSPNYVTPPRYQKSTPRSSFGTQGSQSPLSGSPRASFGLSTSNSPFSPGTGSPLFQKAVNGGSATKRMSFGGSTPGSSFLGESSSSATPSTPTPSTGKASVGLNNKWLYDKRRDSPRSSLFS
ncbi:nuclear pore complex component [Paraphaeosphaeria minitans]|uniref:Nuclear pore complex component n=1 Tax=Paraphaeosphaeria minitans TaxID=565426 RepID=A0A9P6GKG1_9PLEO|nr:nuclear pore complex component [Paraphaeosphaeria minitans]